MKDLSLHLLDIVENSMRADATEIKIYIKEEVARNWLVLKVEDNGKGMPQELLETVTNPFVTSRKRRSVGLGIPLLKQRCELCDGKLIIESNEGEGTNIAAYMRYDHIDRVPLGDIASTLTTLIMGNPDITYIYTHYYNEHLFKLNTIEIKAILGDVPINNNEVIQWLRMYIKQNINEISRKR